MDLLASLTANTARFGDVLHDVEPDMPVPTCPDWTARDLVTHLAQGQWFWGTVVASRSTDPPDDDATVGGGAVLDQLQHAHDRLREALAATDADVPVWSWHQSGGSVGWVLRRQSHEALVHRLDAEATSGTPSPVSTELALDGIDELLEVFVVGIPDWGTFTTSGRRVAITTDDHPRRWAVELGRMAGTSPDNGRTYDLAAAMTADGRTPDLVISGPAASVHAWLWGRGPAKPLTCNGDASLATDLRALVGDATQ